MQKIIVELKSVYGRELFYPVCDNAKRFAKIAKSKTLLEADLLLIQLCGFDIEFKKPEFKFERIVNA